VQSLPHDPEVVAGAIRFMRSFPDSNVTSVVVIFAQVSI
jgi:hypothetical protein